MPTPAQNASPFARLKHLLSLSFGADFRSLALFRVSLALICLVDLFSRVQDLRAHYTDFGVLPRDVYLDKFMGKWIWSFHLATGNEWGMGLLFGLQALFAIWLLVGFRTRLATFLVWIFTLSLQGRMPMVLQAGDVLYRILLFWALFLPLGAKLSVDAALNTLAPPTKKRLLSVGTLAVLFQTAFVYWFSLGFKVGDEWVTDYTAVYFAANLDHFATPLAALVLEYPALMSFFTVFTYWLELLGPCAAFVPWWPIRLLAVALMIMMHVGFGSVLKVGMFVFISTASWLPFLPTGWWDRMTRLALRRRPKDLTIHYSPTPEGAPKLLRVARELLAVGHLPLVATEGAGAPAWYVTDPGGALLTGAAATRRLAQASPLWFPFAPLFGVLYWPIHLLSGVLDRVLVVRAIRWRPTWVGSLICLFAFGYVIAWNHDSLLDKQPDRRIMSPEWKRLAWTVRIDQRWNMFAPYPMKDDGWFVMAGVNGKGQSVDVWHQKDGISFDKPEDVSVYYPGQRWRKYLMNLWLKKYKAHRLHFGRWVCREYNEGLNPTEHRNQRLQSFHLYYIRETTTPTGTAAPECITLWRHWCTPRGKKNTVAPYEADCAKLHPKKKGRGDLTRAPLIHLAPGAKLLAR